MNKFFQNFIGFEGRLNRQPYWLSVLALVAASIVVSLIILPIFSLSMMPNWAQLAKADASSIAALATEMTQKAAWASLISFVIFVYPSAAISIKRRHDRNSSGLDVWIYLGLSGLLMLAQATGIVGYTLVDLGTGMMTPMPSPLMMGGSAILGIYGIYLLVVLGFLKGTAGANQYGPDPLGGGTT